MRFGRREPGGRLVEQQQPGRAGQGQRDLELALLAVRQIAHRLALLVGEPDRVEHVPRAVEEGGVAGDGAVNVKLGRVRACTASRQFSSAVRRGKRFVIWYVRASPSAARRCGG